MSKLSSQEEKELIIFIKDWLKLHNFSQKDLAYKLDLNSSRTSELVNKMREMHKKGGIINIAKRLIQIEQDWLKDKDPCDNYQEFLDKKDNETASYNQLDLNYKLDIDALMDQMEKDHKNT